MGNIKVRTCNGNISSETLPSLTLTSYSGLPAYTYEITVCEVIACKREGLDTRLIIDIAKLL